MKLLPQYAFQMLYQRCYLFSFLALLAAAVPALAQTAGPAPKGLKLATDFAPTLVRANTGPGVNSNLHDLSPVLAPDGQTLYFSRTSGTAGQDQDIWVSVLQPDGSWGTARSIGAPLNNSGPNMVCSVSPDGNTLLLLNTYYPNGSFKGVGLSQSHRTAEGGWSVPEDIVLPGYQNRAQTHQYFLSNDGKVLLMDMEQEPTAGGNDLYVSRKGADGRWTAPVNLGRTINTPAAEQCPFLAADGRTLYFSSAGHPGYGSHDIFMSKRLDDTWVRWSTPLNLGPAVNSAKWEAYFFLPAGTDALPFVVSDEWGSGKADIFRLREPQSKAPVVQLNGRVLDANTRQPVAAAIVCETLPEGKETARAQSDPGSGTFRISIPSGRLYGLRAASDQYISVSENLDLTLHDTARALTYDLLLAPLTAGQKVNLNNIFFYQSKSELLPTSFPELNRLVQLLQSHPTMEILLEGHTDNQGEDDPAGARRNLRLSEERVREVKKYLQKQGITVERVQTKGHGGSRPIAPNSTEETRRLNRRVECTVVRE